MQFNQRSFLLVDELLLKNQDTHPMDLIAIQGMIHPKRNMIRKLVFSFEISNNFLTVILRAINFSSIS